MKLNSSAKFNDILIPLFLLIIFVSIVLTNTQLKNTFEYNPDEGIHLMESLLFLKGFPLYKEVSFGQPPLLIVILSYWFNLLEPSVFYGRILILIFSILLLWAFYHTIKSQRGHFCAFIAVIFLILSTAYARLSISVLNGLPSLGFAMFSIYCVVLYKKSQAKYLLMLSGALMALALQTKLFTIFLIPVIMLEIFQVKKFKEVLLWFITFLSIYLCITIIFFQFDYHLFIQKLIKPHYLARLALNIPRFNFLKMLRIMFNDYDIILLALMGIALLIRQRKRRFLLPVFWLVLALVILFNYSPIWYHYYLLLSIPISWLAAICFSEFFHMYKRRTESKEIKTYNPGIFLRLLTAGIVIITIVRLPIKYERMCESLWCETTIQEQKTVELLSKYKDRTRWIFTDRPIFAFYANILTPPKLGFITLKRRLTSKKHLHHLIYALQKYRPEQILIARFQDYKPEIISYIERRYLKIYQTKYRYREYYPFSVRWYTKHVHFANRIWSYKIPVPIKNNRHYRVTDKEIKFYIRNDIIKAE